MKFFNETRRVHGQKHCHNHIRLTVHLECSRDRLQNDFYVFLPPQRQSQLFTSLLFTKNIYLSSVSQTLYVK